jgi:putative DNA primase/helicase
MDEDIIEDESQADEFYQLHDGRTVELGEQAKVLNKLKKIDPLSNRDYSRNEPSIAELFVEIYRDTTRYCIEAKSWFIFNGKRWIKEGSELEVMDRLLTFIKLLAFHCLDVQSTTTGNDTLCKDYLSFLGKINDRRARERIMKDAQMEARISLSTFDANPYLINCQNGTYNLKDGKFYLHRADDYLTMITECNYPTDVDVISYPRWEQFIDEITCGEKDIATYLQRALGYCLDGTTKEECMFIAYGKTTRNGKGTLFNTIQKILGDYAKAMPVDFICKSRYGASQYDKANPMLAGLRGKRFVNLSESDNAGKLDEAVIKNYTGGDSITARNLYEKDFTFTPQFKMWLSCNSLPAVYDRSIFSSDRLKVIEFNAHFDSKTRDTTLKEQFLEPEVRSVIFKWLIQGYADYRQYGLTEPKAVAAAIDSYEKTNNRVGMFVEEKCEFGETFRTKRGDVYNAYTTWCKCNGYLSLNGQRFFEQISATGATAIKSNGVLMWQGLRIRPSTVQLTDKE